MNASIKLFLRKDYSNPEGKNPVCLRLIINRNQKTYSLGIFLYPDDLMKKDQFIVKGAVKNSSLINIQLRDFESRANAILNDFSRYNIPPTFIEFNKLFKNNLSRQSFYQYALNYIEKNIEFAEETKRTYSSQLSKLNKFLPYSKQTFQEINNLDFITAYKNYMIKDLKNKLNTHSKSLSFIRTVLIDAKKYSMITNNEFEKIELKKEPGKRHFLVMEEIEMLSKYYHSDTITEGRKKVLKYFLFSCYTGLRYRDIKNLRFENIKNYITLIDKKKADRLLIDLKMHKTQRDVIIPLIERALSLVDFNNKTPNSKVFDVLSNQKTNENIKVILQKAKVNFWEETTFHSARHSFATHCIRMGIPLKAVSLALGHTTVRTTEIYTHLVKDTLFSDMDRAFN